MQSQRKAYFTAEEYLEMERLAPTRSEYYADEIFAMAGASPRHVISIANTVASLVTQLKGRPCFTFASDLRVKVSTHGFYTYPDAGVVCGKAQHEDTQRDTVLNPRLLIEVLSDSTEKWDRGRKFAMYRSIESLTDYVLITQNTPLVEHYVRQPNDQWILSDCRGLDAALTIASIDCTLPLADIYDKVEFDADPISPMLRRIKEPEAEYAVAQRRPGMP